MSGLEGDSVMWLRDGGLGSIEGIGVIECRLVIQRDVGQGWIEELRENI